MDQEAINDLMWENLPQWRKDQLFVAHEATMYSFRDYDKRRVTAKKLLAAPGMAGAIIDELKSMGFVVQPTT